MVPVVVHRGGPTFGASAAPSPRLPLVCHRDARNSRDGGRLRDALGRSQAGRKKENPSGQAGFSLGIKKGWRRSTLPQSTCSTIDATELNGRVRDGIGCSLCAIATSQKIKLTGKLSRKK